MPPVAPNTKAVLGSRDTKPPFWIGASGYIAVLYAMPLISNVTKYRSIPLIKS
jgi:hypothetical protein